MKWKNRISSLLFFLLIFIFSAQSYAQLDPPIIKEASILPGTGNVRLRWELTDSGDVHIRRWEPNLPTAPGYLKIAEITDTSITEYIDYDAYANTQPRLYTVRTFRSDNLGETNPDSDKFPTNLLSYEYDSCKSEIKLSWTNRSETFPQTTFVVFSNYEIYSSVDGAPFQKEGETSGMDFMISDIKEKTNYTFYIAAIPEGFPNSRSASNTIDFYSEMAQAPTYINPRIASVNNGIVYLEFNIDPNSELTRYKLLRSTSISGTFDTVKTFQSTENPVKVYDTNADPNKRIYYYKLVALNNCDKPVLESGIINTILLKVKNNDVINTLSWNAFNEYTSPNCYYHIFRIVGNNNPQQIATILNTYTYDDYIEDLIGTNAGSNICYFTYVHETGFNNSNIACAYLEPKIYIPDAFTPNNDGTNDYFKPIFTFLPNNYTLIIYNRWSNVVFKSENPEESWDGRTPGGKQVPAGAYIYYLKIVTETNQTIEKRGNITVIYP